MDEATPNRRVTPFGVAVRVPSASGRLGTKKDMRSSEHVDEYGYKIVTRCLYHDIPYHAVLE